MIIISILILNGERPDEHPMNTQSVHVVLCLIKFASAKLWICTKVI